MFLKFFSVPQYWESWDSRYKMRINERLATSRKTLSQLSIATPFTKSNWGRIAKGRKSHYATNSHVQYLAWRHAVLCVLDSDPSLGMPTYYSRACPVPGATQNMQPNLSLNRRILGTSDRPKKWAINIGTTNLHSTKSPLPATQKNLFPPYMLTILWRRFPLPLFKMFRVSSPPLKNLFQKIFFEKMS